MPSLPFLQSTPRGGHFQQECDMFVENESSGHVAHSWRPSLAENLPGPHGPHSVCSSASAKVPFGHDSHSSAVALGENRPKLHAKHSRLASEGAKRPFAQSVQCDMPLCAECDPAGQFEHDDDFDSDAKRPWVQSTQLPDFVVGATLPTGHSAQFERFDIVPTPHISQAVAPVALENVPVSHS